MQEQGFEFPILTVDGVVFQLVEGKLMVLLIERAFDPYLGFWALPGGYIPKDETSRQALERVLVQKTGISSRQLTLLEQPYAFDAPKRDPRGYAITIMYIGLGGGLRPGTHKGMTNGQNPQFKPVYELPKLAYDHRRIVLFAHQRLKALAASGVAVAPLMPPQFTLSELQAAYEAIFCQRLDKRNFRKKVLALGVLEDTGRMAKEAAHRPARLYRFLGGRASPSPQTFA